MGEGTHQTQSQAELLATLELLAALDYRHMKSREVCDEFSSCLGVFRDCLEALTASAVALGRRLSIPLHFDRGVVQRQLPHAGHLDYG